MKHLRTTPAALAALLAGLLLFYHAAVPLPLRLAGLLLFGGAALLRPELALLTVPLSAPLALMPAALTLPTREVLLPLHEVALLGALGATLLRWLIADRRWPAGTRWSRYVPHALLLLAGLYGALLAVPEGRGAALRELRWLIVEPLLLYALLRAQLARGMPPAWAAAALAAGGAIVAIVGLLQFVGLDVVPLIGVKRAFSENVVAADGLRRVTSVFGHPNNLGLLLERAWPPAAALALWPLGLLAGARLPRRGGPALWALAALICLAGVAVSFSRGAWLGSVAAAAVLGAGWLYARPASAAMGRRLSLLLVGLAALAGVAALGLTLRGGLSGGSTDARVLLWRESLAYLQLRPHGLGLDQFYYYHNPEFGRSLIDPALIGTSEQYASHPHNLLLDAWLNLGPLGLAALGWLVVRLVRDGLAGVRQGDALALGVLAASAAALVHGSVDLFYFAEDLAIVFFLLLALAEHRPTTSAPRASHP